MELEMRHLKLVTAMADAGNMSRAAAVLNVTQSALSHQLRDIEERLGTPLFHRAGRRMVLTPAGERVLRTARVVISELQRAEEEIRRATTGDGSTLRIATHCYTNYHWLPSRLRLFHRKFPRVEVQIVAEATPRPIEALLEGELDLAIVGGVKEDPRIRLEPLFRPEFVAVMRPDHSLAARAFVRPEDFQTQTLILYGKLEENAFYRELLRPAGIEPERVMRVQLTEAILELVKAGAGITVMAKWAVEPQLRSGALRALRLTKRGFRRVWSAATVKSRPRPKYVDEFIRLLAEEPSLKGRGRPVALAEPESQAIPITRGLRAAMG